MKLFVDDMRPFPGGDEWVCCRDYSEAIWELSKQDFEYVSLDYHLGYGESGYDILVWMFNNSKHPAHINIHSSHPYGRSQMKDYCLSHFADSELTMNYIY